MACHAILLKAIHLKSAHFYGLYNRSVFNCLSHPFIKFLARIIHFRKYLHKNKGYWPNISVCGQHGFHINLLNWLFFFPDYLHQISFTMKSKDFIKCIFYKFEAFLWFIISSCLLSFAEIWTISAALFFCKNVRLACLAICIDSYSWLFITLVDLTM